jgi:MFS family permease
MTVAETKSGNIGFAGLLALLFIGLKLTGHITWSWWWVLSPFWVTALFALVLVVISIITLAVIEVRKVRAHNKGIRRAQ